jgi:hypothetical protein
MPQSIPAGLTRSQVLQAIDDLDAGVDHPFRQPTGYELLHEEKRHPPKAVIGLACKYSLGRVLMPEEFSGGGRRAKLTSFLESSASRSSGRMNRTQNQRRHGTGQSKRFG